MVQQRRNTQRARALTVFIGLAIVYAVLVIVANLVFSGSLLIQILLLSLGSAVLGAGVAFFLIRLEQLRNNLASVIGTFMALTGVFVALALVALLLFASNAFAYTLLLTTGATIFGGSLTFFLVRLA
jgi:hypothetical protein